MDIIVPYREFKITQQITNSKPKKKKRLILSKYFAGNYVNRFVDGIEILAQISENDSLTHFHILRNHFVAR